MTAEPLYQSTPKNALEASSEKSVPAPFWLPALANTAYFVFASLYSPVFFKKMKQAADPQALWDQRRGIFSEPLKRKLAGKKTVWVHAVSVGEVMAIRRFLSDFPQEFHIVLTTVTPTGQRIAKELEGDQVTVLYFPFDFSSVCGRFFETLKPQALLLAETEIWPNLLLQAKKFHVPVGILNARLSAKSEKRYKQFSFLFRGLFGCLSFVLAQTEDDAARFISLGVSARRVAVLGNMKFDNVNLADRDPQAAAQLKREWNFDAEDLLWVAGSTHPQEEDVLFRAYSRLKQEFPRLKLILAPRHIERSEQISAQIQRMGLRPVQATQRASQREFDVLVLDQLGVLKNLYQMADAVYVGGSLSQRGGQNPIEPASFRKAVVHGPHIFNFEKIYRELDQEGGALKISDEAQLIHTIRRLLQDEAWRDAGGERAYEWVRSLQGATRRHGEWVSQFLVLRSQERISHGFNDTELFPPSGGRL